VAFGFVYRRQQLLLFGLKPMRAEHLAIFFAALLLLLGLLAGDYAGLAASVAAGVVGALAATERLRFFHLVESLPAWWRGVQRARLKRRYHVLRGGKDDAPTDPPERPDPPERRPSKDRRYLN
jgi:hypothetical protein